MIARVRGRALRWDAAAQSVEVDVGGIAYEVLLPTFCWRALEHQPDDLDLYTLYYAPERNPTPLLFGFLRPVERNFFKKLMRVRGMGPTKAMKALATSISTMARWIEAEDKAALRSLPGVGPRQADQIIAELKGKVVEETLLRDEHYTELPAAPAPVLARALEDAVAALVNLGYPQRDATRWVEEVCAQPHDLEPEPEAILRAVFKHMAPSA